MNARPARKRVHAIAQGRGAAEHLAIPLAFEIAAQISARPLAEFRTDPTHLTNGLTELQRAINADTVCCALADDVDGSLVGAPLTIETLTAPGREFAASLEACRRLRATAGDTLALLAGLPGPATLAARFATDLATSAPVFTALAKEFCAAGADLILIFDAISEAAAWHDCLRTTSNIARFHRGVALLWEPGGALPCPTRRAVSAPLAGGAGITTTDCIVPADTNLEALRHWVAVSNRQ